MSCWAHRPLIRSGYYIPQPIPHLDSRSRPSPPRPAPLQPPLSASPPASRPTLSASRLASRPTLSASPPASRPTLSASPPASRPALSASRHASRPTPSAPSSSLLFAKLPPQPTYTVPRPASQPTQPTSSPSTIHPILVDHRIHPEAGTYSFTSETVDGVKRQESGKSVYSEDGPITAVSGSYSFTLPDGQVFQLSYVADENGFQPESQFLPVAPAFPHPIPAHALEQIERGRLEHEARQLRQTPAHNYGV
nr:endocuticle structural glycoprotein SgAbd-1-like [Procambarus clarkii]